MRKDEKSPRVVCKAGDMYSLALEKKFEDSGNKNLGSCCLSGSCGAVETLAPGVLAISRPRRWPGPSTVSPDVDALTF